MVEEKELEARLLDVSELTDEQLEQLRAKANRESTIRHRKEAQEAKKLVIITDFKDERVKPFEKGAVYTVYNEKQNTEVLMHGKYIEGFIASSDEKYKAFEKKQLGTKITMDGKEITFKHYEYRGK